MKRSDLGHILKKIAKVAGFILSIVLAVLLLLALIPVSTSDLNSNPDPAIDYEDAVQRVQAILDYESTKVCDICGTRLYTHGGKTEKVVVLIHGLTNSPRQFEELGKELFDDGYNVLIVRMPFHGLSTHTVAELGKLKTVDLSSFADESVDIADGLGDEVTVVGLSGGGTIAGWIAQNRADVDKAVLIAPLYGMAPIPPFGNYLLGNLFSRLPNVDYASSSEPPRESVYLGWSTRGVAEYLIFSRVAKSPDGKTPAAVKNILLITNANDHTVNNGMSNEVVDTWAALGARTARYEFDESLGLPHDTVDITGLGDRKDETYPVFISEIESG